MTAPEQRGIAGGRALPVWYSLLLAVPLLAATVYGLSTDDAYRTPADIAAQGRGQDLLTLTTVPLLVWTAAGVWLASAALLWRDHPASPVLAAVVLLKKVTLTLAILSMVVFELAGGIAVNPVMVGVFATSAVVDLTLLTVGGLRMRPVAGAWLRRSWWQR